MTDVAIHLEGSDSTEPELTPLAQAATIIADLITARYDEDEDVCAYARETNVFVEAGGVTVKMTVTTITELL